MRELVINRIKEIVAGDDEFEDTCGETHVVAELDTKSDEFLLTIFEDLVGFQG